MEIIMEEINLKEIFNMFWSRKKMVIGIMIVAILAGLFYTKTMVKPDYKATVTLVLVKDTTGNNEETITQTEVTLNQKLVATYTELIRSISVLREVIQNQKMEIGENELRGKISVNLVQTTQLIEIAVKDANPEKAKVLANEITKVFMKKVEEIYKISNINIVDEAKIPTLPYNVNHTKDLMLAIAFGIFLSFVYVLIANMLDTTIKGQEETEKRLELPVLASIPQYDYEIKKKGGK